MAFPIKKLVLPRDLKGKQNGKLPAEILGNIGPYGQMHHLAANAWEAMRAHAAKDGITLAHVGDYRPYDKQYALFMQRYVKGDSGDSRRITRKFQGAVWMLKPKMAQAAVPGTSNHGWGLAIDSALKVNGKVVSISSNARGKTHHKTGVDWLLDYADSYGFSWELQSEPWHLRYYPAEAVPQAVQNWLAGKPRPPKPATTPATSDNPTVAINTKKPWPGGKSLRMGMRNNINIKAVQTRLGIKADGNFGPQTNHHVVDFQKKNPACGPADGVVGPKTWKVMFG
jgi:LAS superfamily LD-carboxypeptidase LdcB